MSALWFFAGACVGWIAAFVVIDVVLTRRAHRGLPFKESLR